MYIRHPMSSSLDFVSGALKVIFRLYHNHILHIFITHYIGILTLPWIYPKLNTLNTCKQTFFQVWSYNNFLHQAKQQTKICAAIHNLLWLTLSGKILNLNFFQKIVLENCGIKFKCDKKWVLDAMEEFVDNFYSFEYSGIVDEDCIDFEVASLEPNHILKKKIARQKKKAKLWQRKKRRTRSILRWKYGNCSWK